MGKGASQAWGHEAHDGAFPEWDRSRGMIIEYAEMERHIAPYEDRRMERSDARLPVARAEGLTSEVMGGELVVYDRERHRCHDLNRPATVVWRACDGETTVAAMALRLQAELRQLADEGLVWLALDRLARPVDGARYTRRDAMRSLGLAGGLTALLPVITSIVC